MIRVHWFDEWRYSAVENQVGLAESGASITHLVNRIASSHLQSEQGVKGTYLNCEGAGSI